ncbi:hypothetical protein FisN_10Hh353 [Fistulifera solaris]|uniref:Uncharacterized protein n=1 Tax=Fistulifera solaris TaxID=1519565 RepID=A0A1Z5JQW0_FISSO|nr:hypothetical protein FisN_10Hh353 [Fistulifera solaris]|eukprot:GAX16410.1 hypothetical protein FisN_10Hh353 [Fistulifera solaris]
MNHHRDAMTDASQELERKESEIEAVDLSLHDDENVTTISEQDTVRESNPILNDSNSLCRKGILAFLPDTLQYFPYRADAWEKDPFPSLAATRYRRVKRQNIESGIVYTETVQTNRWIAACTSVAVFLVDPRQPSSRHFIPLFVRRLAQRSNTTARGIFVIMTDDLDESVLDYLEHSGLAWTYLSTCSPFLTQVLSWTSCPALAVCTSTTGRKISATAEEMALEWHPYSDPDPVVTAWNAGVSALSWRQQMAAAILAPSCVVQ